MGANDGTTDLIERFLAGGRAFVKMHGLRNDFVIVDGRERPFRPDVSEIVWICDRHAGIGGDQLLVLERPRTPGSDVFLRILNVDGREVGMCGNATRCVAWLLMEETGRPDVVLETLAGRLRCVRTGPMSVAVNLGPIRTGWRDVPLSEPRDTLHLGLEAGPLRDPVAVNVGNPQVVFFVDNFDAVDIPAHAPAIQNDPLFPEQANVAVAQVLDDRTIRLQVWERPGLLTEACGSGACAAAAAARARKLIAANEVEVRMPGGTVRVTLLDDGSVVMDGEVAVAFAGRMPDPAAGSRSDVHSWSHSRPGP
jgi:diaminopimelate epimerase